MRRLQLPPALLIGLCALASSLTACNDDGPVGDEGSESGDGDGDGDGDSGDGDGDGDGDGGEGASGSGGEAAGDGDGEGDGDGDGEPALCGPQPNDDECTMCLKDSCCAELETCLADRDCLCVSACVDEGEDQLQCHLDCGLPDPNLLFGMLATCTMFECGQQCG